MTGEIIISLISILISAAAFINAFSFPGGTSDGVPGAGVFPQALCVIIAVINLVLIFWEVKEKKQKKPMTETEKDGLKRFGMLAAATAVFIAAWGMIHFVIICSVYLILVGLILKQNMKTFVPGAIVSSALIFFIFQQILNVMLNN
ncbi:tripartite tricarboxylate transporter TctB family protein [Lachnospiraceae bacterium 62-35]